MRYITQAALTRALGTLALSTVRLVAAEVGCVEHRRGRATHAVTARQLAEFLHAHPLMSRRAAFFLKRSSHDPKYQPVIDAALEVRGAGRLEIGAWLITAVSEGCLQLQPRKGEAIYIEYSRDPRVGLIVLTSPDATTALPLALVQLPKGVLDELPGLLTPVKP